MLRTQLLLLIYQNKHDITERMSPFHTSTNKHTHTHTFIFTFKRRTQYTMQVDKYRATTCLKKKRF